LASNPLQDEIIARRLDQLRLEGWQAAALT
jgi:hypothetical protein